MGPNVNDQCRCGLSVAECDRGSTAAHDARIKALADATLGLPAVPAAVAPCAAVTVDHELDGWIRTVAMSADAARRFLGRVDAPEDLGPPIDPERYKPGARVWGFRVTPREITPAMAGLAPEAPDPESAMTVADWDNLRALCTSTAATYAATAATSVKDRARARVFGALAAKCEARLHALRAGRVIP